jgi:hypothetical protein
MKRGRSRRCQWITVDGMPVRVQTDGRALSEKDRQTLAEIVRAAQRVIHKPGDTATPAKARV